MSANTLPPGVSPYERTPTFDQDSLRYRILEPPSEVMLVEFFSAAAVPGGPHTTQVL